VDGAPPPPLTGARRTAETPGPGAVTAEDGAAGFRAARDPLPDLILTDVVMPNLSGFQATRTIKRDAATGHIPVILVTTKDQETDRIWGVRQGAQGYLTKPFSEAELTETIVSTIGHGSAPPPDGAPA